MSVKIQLKHSSVQSKVPLATDLVNGELALNINAASPAAYIKDSAGNVIQLAGVSGSATAPTSPATGAVWIDSSQTPNVINVWNGTSWIPQAGATIASGTAPATPATGQIWVDTSVSPNVTKIWDGTAWVTVTAGGSDAQAIANDAKYATKEELTAADDWQRTGTELSPVNAGDSVFTSGAVKVGGTTAAPSITVNDGSGRLLVGTSTSVAVDSAGSTFNSELQVAGSSASVTIARNIGSGSLFLARNQTVVNSTPLGFIGFQGGDGTNLIQAASIQAQVDGTPGANDMPGRLVFSTTASGSATPTPRMTIKSDGKVGIGTAVPEDTLDCLGRIRVTQSGNNPRFGSIEAASDQFQLKAFGGAAGQTAAMCFYTGDNSPTEKARIDSSGRLLVGTSTAVDTNSKLQIESDTNDKIALKATSAVANNGSNINWYVGSTYKAAIYGGNDASSSSVLTFSTTADGASSPTERMRISSSGQILLGCTNAPSPGAASTSSGFAINGTDNDAYITAKIDNNPLGYFRRDGTDGTVFEFRKANTSVGTISVTASATAYNTSSDYRLKENVVPLTGAADRVNQLKVHRFNFIVDPDKTVDGFIAHEAQAVVPECVSGEKDAVDADGKPKYQGIDQSKLVPLLTAALQEALAEIESLKARVAALEP